MNDLTSLDIEADRLADKFDDPGLANRLDAAIDRALVERRIVGGVVLVARGGEVIFRRAAGFADREAGIPMREDAIFLLASLTKPIVTAAIMRLVEQHRIELDAPVTDWLPDFQPKPAGGTTPANQTRQLHTPHARPTPLSPPP